MEATPGPALLKPDGTLMGYLSCTSVHIQTESCDKCEEIKKGREKAIKTMAFLKQSIRTVRSRYESDLKDAQRARDYFQARYELLYDNILHVLSCHLCSKTTEYPNILRCGHQVCQPCIDGYMASFGEDIDASIVAIPCPFSFSSSQTSGRKCRIPRAAVDTRDENGRWPLEQERLSRLIWAEIDEDEPFQLSPNSNRPYLNLRARHLQIDNQNNQSARQCSEEIEVIG